MDFTLDKYSELCKSIATSKYIALTLNQYLTDQKYANSKVLIMRHDIDQDCRYSLDLARIENNYSIQATYYFRMKKKTYSPEIINIIGSYGHEIGYHYETLDIGKGDMNLAEEIFKRELAHFRTKYNVTTVCAHGNPLTKYDNKDIWKNMNLGNFGLIGEAFLSLDYTQFAYFSDSGRTWLNNKSQKMPGKDSVNTAFEDMNPKSTDHLIEIIQEGELPNICILTHPERWSKTLAAFTRRYLIDLVFSWGKTAIYTYRWGFKQ